MRIKELVRLSKIPKRIRDEADFVTVKSGRFNDPSTWIDTKTGKHRVPIRGRITITSGVQVDF